MGYPIKVFRRYIAKNHIEKVTGLENLPQNKPLIIASNHDSFMDPFVLWAAVNKHIENSKMYFISEMFFIWDFLTKLVFKNVGGALRIDRKTRSKVLEQALEKLKKGHVIAVAPEGIIKENPDIRRCKTGTARLVLIGKIPLVPVGIRGDCYVWSLISAIKWISRPKKKAIIRIGKPMHFDRYFDKKINKQLLETVTSEIMIEIGRLCGKRYKEG
jgi:1-acyl-sn-glycerol-3-phosphate acyltransferase